MHPTERGGIQRRGIIRRYTNLASIIHILRTRKLTLLNPATWDDRNDAYFMAEYKRLKKAQSVLALCFAETSRETYHHWRVFSHGSDGVCVHFYKNEIESTLSKCIGIKCKKVKYINRNEAISSKNITVDELPFIKRMEFKDEREYRVIYAGYNGHEETKHCDIEISSIDQIVMSPWLATDVAIEIRQLLNSIDGCNKLGIKSSRLLNSSLWRGITSRFET